MHPLRITAQLWVKSGRFAAFEAFEAAAFKIMERHGGQVISVQKTHGASGNDPHETHQLEFPTRAAFDAYRQDPDLLAMGQARDACIERTEVAFS